MTGTAWTNSASGPRSIRFQNSRSRGKRSSGALPAMMLALMAPIEVPTTQSGSMPASWRA
jgi:hypothetical protein